MNKKENTIKNTVGTQTAEEFPHAEKMAAQLRKRRVWMYVLLIVSVVLIVAVQFQPPLSYDTQGKFSNYLMGFQSGLLTSFVGIAIINIISCSKSLRDPRTLEQKYIEENDERAIEIGSRSGRMTLTVAPILLLLAAVVVAYFSAEAFAALVAAVFFICFMTMIFKIYYSKKI